MTGEDAPRTEPAPDEPRGFRAAIVAPRFGHDPSWPWLSGAGPMRLCRFQRLYIENTFGPLPKATPLYRRLQHRRAAQRIIDAEVAFLFSTEIVLAVTAELERRPAGPRRIYVGFTQDGRWPRRRLERIGRALRRCDAVTMFTEQERSIYIERYALDPARTHVIPIHTDDTEGYRRYLDAPRPLDEPYVLSLGITNRRFTAAAAACRELGIPLVILTRPHAAGDDLEALARGGARVITDADQVAAWSWLRHARLAVMDFRDGSMPGGFTTVMNAMFLGTPFIASECLGIRELVSDGETGFVVPHHDEPALRRAIERLWSEPGLAERFGAAARHRAAERHSLEAAAHRFHELACRVLDEG